MHFDMDMTHPYFSVYDEGKILTNSDIIDKEIKTFPGIRGVKPISQVKSTVSKVAVMVDMKKKASVGQTLLQIGLSSRENVDSMVHDYFIALTQCLEQNICLIVKQKRIAHRKYIVARNVKGSSFSVLIYTIVSARDTIESISYAFSGNLTRTELLHRFSEEQVEVGQELWPVYGVFDPETATVVMSVLKSPDHDAAFQKRTCHKDIYVSPCGRILSNKRLEKSFQSGNVAVNKKMLYMGAVADMPFSVEYDYDNYPSVFAVNVSGKVDFSKTRELDMIYEISLGTKDLISKRTWLKQYYWARSFYFWRCMDVHFSRNLCITFFDRGTEDVKSSYNIPNEDDNMIWFNHVYGIILNPQKRYIGVYSITNNRKLHEFNDVDFSSSLYPIFGISDKTYTTITLLTKENIPNFLYSPEFEGPLTCYV